MTRRRRALGLGLSLALLAALLWVVDLGVFVRTLTSVSLPTYLLATAVFASTYAFIAVRWQILANTASLGISLPHSFEITALSYGLNKILPANSGDLARSKITQQYVAVDSHGRVLGLVVLERLADVGTVCVIVALGLPFVSGNGGLALSLIAGAVLVAIVAAALHLNRLTVPTVAWLPNGVRSEIGLGRDAIESVPRGTLLVVLGISMVRWLFLAAVFVLLGASIGMSISLPVAAVATATMSLAAIVPLAPGGLGTVDATGTWILVIAAIPPTDAFTLVVLQRSLGLGFMALVGFLVYNYRLAVPPEEAKTET